MSGFKDRAVIVPESIEVGFLYEKMKDRLQLKLLSDESGFNRKITEQNLNRPGLALAGFIDLFTFARIQIFGNTEHRYLCSLPLEEKSKAIDRVFHYPIPCLIYTNNNTPDESIIVKANELNIPLFISSFTTTKFNYLLTDFLEDQFAPRVTVHGSFVDVYGVGILLIGKSGIGKSEIALDLIERGHRLVADDVTMFTKKGEGILMGSSLDMSQGFVEIRGLGILNIAKMFGVRSIRYQKRLEVIVNLEIFDANQEYDRLGLDENMVTILDVDIPEKKLPILPGKNITVIAEVIALNYLLKHYGYDSAEDFRKRLMNALKSGKGKAGKRGIDYFEHDFE